MPPKRSASASRSRSRGRKARSTSRSRTPTRSRSRRAVEAPAAAAAAAAKATAAAVVAPVTDATKPEPTDSMWEADAKLMEAMGSGRSHVRSTGVRGMLAGKRGRVWGYWVAIIVFQVVAIVWAKWAIDMYKQYHNQSK